MADPIAAMLEIKAAIGATGNFENWWTDADLKSFEQRSEEMEEQRDFDLAHVRSQRHRIRRNPRLPEPRIRRKHEKAA